LQKNEQRGNRKGNVLDPKNHQRVMGIVSKADLLHALVTQDGGKQNPELPLPN
jgi:CBS-domain-containing membrane protein